MRTSTSASFTAQLEAQLEAQNAARTVVDVAEEKVNAELAMKLAEVADGYGVAGAVGTLEAMEWRASSRGEGGQI